MASKIFLFVLHLFLVFAFPTVCVASDSSQLAPPTVAQSAMSQEIIGQGTTGPGQWYGDCSNPPLGTPQSISQTVYINCIQSSCPPQTAQCRAEMQCYEPMGYESFCMTGDQIYEFVPANGCPATASCSPSFVLAPANTTPATTSTCSYQPVCPYVPPSGSQCTTGCSNNNGIQQCSYSGVVQVAAPQPCLSCTPGSSSWCKLGTTQTLCPSGTKPFVVLSLVGVASGSSTCTITSSAASSLKTQATANASGTYDVSIQAQITSTSGCSNFPAQFHWLVTCQ